MLFCCQRGDMKKSTLIAALGLALHGSVAAAQGKKPDAAAAPAPAPMVSANAAADLKSGDFGKIRAALDEIRLAGKVNGAKYAPQIAELLAKGLTAQLTESAIDTLGDLESEATSP